MEKWDIWKGGRFSSNPVCCHSLCWQIQKWGSQQLSFPWLQMCPAVYVADPWWSICRQVANQLTCILPAVRRSLLICPKLLRLNSNGSGDWWLPGSRVFISEAEQHVRRVLAIFHIKEGMHKTHKSNFCSELSLMLNIWSSWVLISFSNSIDITTTPSTQLKRWLW